MYQVGEDVKIPVANFGGTIADLWESHDTGPAMSLFLWAATCTNNPLPVNEQKTNGIQADRHLDTFSSHS